MHIQRSTHQQYRETELHRCRDPSDCALSTSHHAFMFEFGFVPLCHPPVSVCVSASIHDVFDHVIAPHRVTIIVPPVPTECVRPLRLRQCRRSIDEPLLHGHIIIHHHLYGDGTTHTNKVNTIPVDWKSFRTGFSKNVDHCSRIFRAHNMRRYCWVLLKNAYNDFNSLKQCIALHKLISCRNILYIKRNGIGLGPMTFQSEHSSLQPRISELTDTKKNRTILIQHSIIKHVRTKMIAHTDASWERRMMCSPH